MIMDIDNIEINQVAVNEVEKLRQLAIETFRETFAEDNSSQDMKNYLDKQFNIQQVSKELNNPMSAFYFAQIDGEHVGYLKINWGTTQTEQVARNGLEIERIYVRHQYHGSQVAKKLFEKALSVGRRKEFEFVWLGVWEENPRAIRFYQKQGFSEFDKHQFKLGSAIQTDIMMKLSLN